MKKQKPTIQHPRKRKYIRADADNQRILRRKARALKKAMEFVILDVYTSEEIQQYRCPMLSLEEIVDRTGLAGDECIAALFAEHCHDYMKKGIKAAIEEGVPAVMVTRHFCTDVSVDEYESAEDIDVMKSWLAGFGPGSKAAGILFVDESDMTASVMYLLAVNRYIKVTNGLIQKNLAMLGAAVNQQLPHFENRAAIVNQLRGVKLLPTPQ